MAVNPGPGSVIYRGLAAVNVGGVVVAMVFSLLLLPSLMRLTTPQGKAPCKIAAPIAKTQRQSRAPHERAEQRSTRCAEIHVIRMSRSHCAARAALPSARRRRTRKAQPAKPPEPPPTVVEVAKADIARIAPRHWAPGSVVSRDDAKLATSAAGRLEYVAEVGTRLKAGDRVAKLEDETIRLRLEDAKTEVARITAQRELADRTRERLEKLDDDATASPRTSSTKRVRRSSQYTAQLRQAEVRVRSAQHDLEQTEAALAVSGRRQRTAGAARRICRDRRRDRACRRHHASRSARAGAARTGEPGARRT